MKLRSAVNGNVINDRENGAADQVKLNSATGKQEDWFMNRGLLFSVTLLCLMVLGFVSTDAKDNPGEKKPGGKSQATKQKSAVKPVGGLVRLAKEQDIWIHPKKKWVVLDGVVCLREGQLEMFACPKETKEHESIIAVNSQARFVHAALLAVGSRVGHPVKFEPKYEAATGTVVDIAVLWKGKKGQKQVMRAQDWVRSIRSKKILPYPWVFGGSGFWTDQTTGKRHYYGDGGDFICVSNFPSAMLDLPVESSQANSSLTFVANTENIPPMGTPVRLVLMPRIAKKTQPAAEKPGKPAGKPKPPTMMDKDSPLLKEVQKLDLAAKPGKSDPGKVEPDAKQP